MIICLEVALLPATEDALAGWDRYQIDDTKLQLAPVLVMEGSSWQVN